MTTGCCQTAIVTYHRSIDASEDVAYESVSLPDHNTKHIRPLVTLENKIVHKNKCYTKCVGWG